ncbi:MAG: UDP-2,4-diacetamido-2,4,6-trideoxy-beta-L-altropyranose hydrolase, partial [Alphaproteobacteria bacterium]|nr:UDP-2,4-diacetamido-2,4,6-trideoxy-beta-L-altropyranose hydrolase [Alphaproteobacteria bacterium]
MPKLAVIRADAGVGIGGGHVVRCLALAEALMTDGWIVGFACSRESTEVIAALRTGRYEVLALSGGPEPAALAHRWPQGCDLLIVDHY